MTNSLSGFLQEVQQFTKEIIFQFSLSQDASEQVLALEALAKKIAPLFEKSLSNKNGPSNTHVELCAVVPKPENRFNAQEYAQKCVLACPELFPFFKQLFHDLSNSPEQIIDLQLGYPDRGIPTAMLMTAVTLLCYIIPKTTDGVELLVERIEKTCIGLDEKIKHMSFDILAKTCNLQHQLTNYVFMNPNANGVLIFKISRYKIEEEPLQVPKICALLSRLTEAWGWGCLPPYFESQISEINNSDHQREALNRFRTFLLNSRIEEMPLKQFALLIKHPLNWIIQGKLDYSVQNDLTQMISIIANNEAGEKIVEEAFQTFSMSHPLNELMLLSDEAKSFLLFLSLLPMVGISKKVCDALYKQVCPSFQKDEHLKIYTDVLSFLLRTNELHPIDKEYLLSRILKEPAPIPCMRMIHAIEKLDGLTLLQKIRLEKSTFSDILKEIFLGGANSLSPIVESNPKTQVYDAESDPIAAKMIAEILNFDGFKKEAARDKNYGLKNNQTVAEVQGSIAFCEKVLQYATETPFVLSPSSLRVLQTVTSLVLRFKKFGHDFSLQGMLKLPDDTLVSLEGFNETFVVPMLRAKFDAFASQRKDLVSEELSNFVKEALSKATWHDNASDAKIDEIHKLIHDPNYHYPVVVSSGWIWHSTQVIFHKGHLYYCNRGSDCNAPGIVIYKIGNKEKITPEFLKRIASRLSVENATYTSEKKIKEELEASSIRWIYKKGQKAGNCVIANLKTAIFTLMMLGTARETNNTIAHMSYKAFSQFDKETDLEDFLKDFEEVSAGRVSIEENKNYLEALNTVADQFEKWALSHRGKKQKISTDLLLRAVTLLC